MKKRLLSMLLVICLLASLLPAAMAAELDEEPAAEESAAEEVVEAVEPADDADEPIVPAAADGADAPKEEPAEAEDVPVVPAAVETADEPIVPAAADDVDAPEDAPAEAEDVPVVPAAVETADELIAPAAADDADVPEDAPADAADEPETPKLDAEEAAEPAEASEGADAPKEPIVEENTGKREAPGLIKAAEPAEDAEEVEESDEEAVEEPVRVEFVCDPADAVVTVYDPAEKDENGENAVIEPQSDGAYMLLPGEYLYDAECEGFERVEGVAFRVAAPEDGEALCFDVTLSPLPDRGTEKTRGIKASGVCGANGDNLTWTLSDSGELVISGTGPMADYSDEEGNLAPWKSNEPDKGDLWGITSVSIASGVTSIGNYAFFRSELTSVTIPGSVTSIGDYAIYCCPWLTSVTIPGSVTSIGNGAFFNCDSLTSVTIPSGVATIGELAFSACFSLSAIQVASDNANYCSVDGVLFSKDKTELLAFPAGKGTSYAIPAFVKSIGDFAFSSCINLESITIPTGVTSIGLEAFVDCVALTSVTIPGSVTSIGIASFVGCDALTSVTISQGVTSIGDDAFYVCNALTSVTIPGSVTSIGANAFAECASLTSVTFSQGVTSIGDWSFQRCPALTTVTIPDSVTSIGEGAFAHCPALASLTIPGSVTSIGSWAFQECHSLTGITIPKNLTSIGVGAFSWCQGLTAFSVASGNTAFTAADGVLFTKNKEALFCYPAGKSGSYTVPSGVSSISAYAFEGCSLLSSVTIPGSVRSIGEWCFEFCDSLNTIRFTGSAPAIDEGAFNSVTATAYYPAGDASWTAEVRQNYYGTITWKADSSVSALTAPVLTEAFNSATGVRVSWLAVGHAAKYQLLRKNLTKGETSWSVVGETTDLTLIDKSAVSASRYTFSVRAVDANGNIGPCDETGRTCTYIAKADITELKAVTNGVSITWSKPAGAKNFRVMRKKDGETKWNVIAVIEGTSYIDTTAKTGIKYWYTVRGVSMDNTVVINSYNGTGWSLNYAPAPTMTEAFNSSTGVRVSWKSVSNAAKYRLLRKNVTLGETQWQTVGETKDCTLIDKTAKSSNRYTYTVQCIDSNGRTSSAPNAAGRTCTYIAMSKITSIGSVSNGIKLVWSQPAGAKNFRVMRKADGESKYTAIADVLGTSYIDKTAVKGVKYWYTVRAITLAGDMYINSYNSYGWSCTR